MATTKIKVSPKTKVTVKKAEKVETDAQVIKRLRERFDILNDMTQASVDGVVRGMVVTGPPGVGKSFGVEQVLNENRMFDKMAGKRDRFQVIKGASSAIGLYKVLFENADKGSVLVMDDCDTVLHDETSLNLLKAALDSGKKRMLSWNTDSALLRREGIPDRFEFKGSVIFITNLKFEGTRGKLKDHLDAIMSRCHYLDLTLDTMRDKFLRCKQLVADGMLDEYKFEKKQVTQLMNYMSANKENLREVSLRMVTKIADLMKHNPSNWKRYVEVTCMRRVAKG
tara:strand:+ start:3068 stop:3913 length:846 start_codon:yes stop_codon:yes gene_type:complete